MPIPKFFPKLQKISIILLLSFGVVNVIKALKPNILKFEHLSVYWHATVHFKSEFIWF
jgi:hypothetical protein